MSRIKRSWKSWFWLAAMIFLLASAGSPLFGQGQQTATATLSGTVTDPQGLGIAGAKVTLTSGQLGISRVYSTGPTGLYTFTFLPSAVYRLEVQSPGFKQYIQNGITLAAGQTIEQNVSLTLGATTQTVEVTSQAPLLNVDNANISSDVAAKQIQDLPLDFRSVIALAELNSSVSNNVENMHLNAGGMTGVADQDISFLHFGGTHFGTAEYLLDGSWDTRDDWGGVIFVPSVDDVQEFKIQPYAFSAQYGFSGGSVINVVTKGGTNDFHGDAYMFYRNQDVDAVTPFLTRVGGSRKQFGGTVGGPIRKKKTFLFGNYEGLRQAIPAGRLDKLPTDAERAGDFSALLGGVLGQDYEGRNIYRGEIYNPFTTRSVDCGGQDSVTGMQVNNCPAGRTVLIRDPIDTQANLAAGIQRMPAALRDRIGLKIATFWPSPSSPLAHNCTAAGSCSFTSTSPSHSNEYSVRVDHNFSNNTRGYARWSQKFEQKTNLPQLYGADDPGGPGLVNPNNRWSTSLGANHIFGPTFAMSASLGVNRHVEGGLTQGWGFKPSTLGFPAFTDTLASMPIFPQVTVGGGYAGLGANGGNNNYITPMTLWTGTVDFTKEIGKHQFAFGFMDVWLQHNGGHYGGIGPNGALNFSNGGYGTGGPDPSSVNGNTGDGFASLMMGVGTGSANLATFPTQAKHFLGWYFQDTWKVTRKLTISPGLRYEIQTPYKERHNAMEHFDFLATNPITNATPQCVGAVTIGTTTFPGGCISNYPLLGTIVYRTPDDRNLYNTNWKNFAPRIGFAYQATNNLVIRSGYGIFFEPNYYQQANNDGFSSTTSWIANFDGVTPASTLAGNSSPICSTATSTAARNMVPCNFAFSTRVSPTGNTLGGLQGVGLGSGGVNPIRKSPYVQQWMFGVGFAFSTQSVLDINYVGNHGVHNLYVGLGANNLTASQLLQFGNADPTVSNPFFGHINDPAGGGYQIPGGAASACGLDKPTVLAAQLARPYPEFCGVNNAEAPVGTSTYHSLQTTFRHRWHSGLDLNVSYTFSKFLSNGEGAQGGFYANGGLELGSNNYQDVYNLAAEKSVDAADTPHSLVVNYNYELPFGRGKMIGAGWGRPLNAILGGWSWSGIFNAKSGLPISITEGSSQNLSVQGIALALGQVQRPNLTGQSLVPATQSLTAWINKDAFARPNRNTYGNAPRYFSNLRGPSFFDWDAALHKTWAFTEVRKVELRFEMYNAINRPNYYLPNGDLSSAFFGQIRQAFPARSLQFAGKFYF